MDEQEIDIQEHWSYTIMGNWLALDYFAELFRICSRAMTTEERNRLNNGRIKIRELMKDIIDRCYDELFNFVRDQKSRLSYLVMGVFIMQFGGKITEFVRKEILHYSQWRFERHQLMNPREKDLREKYLLNFREKLSTYTSGEPTFITEEFIDDVCKKGRIYLTPISYQI